MSDDRTVHGLTVYGREIVRYDRAGKWYVEDLSENQRERVSLASAARFAVHGTFYPGLLGGQMFDARVRKLRRDAAASSSERNG